MRVGEMGDLSKYKVGEIGIISVGETGVGEMTIPQYFQKRTQILGIKITKRLGLTLF